MSAIENPGLNTVDPLQAVGSQTGTPGGQRLSPAEMIAASNNVAAALAGESMRARRARRPIHRE
jgi:hypothetical protein